MVVVTTTGTSRAGKHGVVGTTMSMVVVVAAVTSATAPSTVTVMLADTVSKPVPVIWAACPSTSVSGVMAVTLRSVASAVKTRAAVVTPGTVASTVWVPRAFPRVHSASALPFASVGIVAGDTEPPPLVTA